MAYCGPRGIPYRFFLGGKHRWTGYDRAAAQAWAEREADRCPGCGLHHADMAEAGGRHDRLPVKGEYHFCVGCEAKELAKKPEGDKGKASHFRWVPRALAKAASRRRR